MIVLAPGLEWEVLARILGLAAAAGLHLPVLLVLPWLLTLLPGSGLPGTGELGGLASAGPAALGVLLLAGGLLLRRLPVVGTALTLVLAGAGVTAAALLPWLLSPGIGGGIRIFESVVALAVSGSLAGVGMGWKFILAHPPATLPGSEHLRHRRWPFPALAGVLVLGTVFIPVASALLSLILLSLALWPGRGALRASGFAMDLLFRSLMGAESARAPEWALAAVDPEPGEGVFTKSAGGSDRETAEPGSSEPPGASRPDPRGVPAALLGYGGGGLRPGWLIGGMLGEAHLCFRYRTPLGAWDLDLTEPEAETIDQGPLVHVRSISRQGSRYVLLLPPGFTPRATGSTDPVRRNL